MKKIVLMIALLASLMVPASAQYKITGDVTGIDEGSLLYLTLVGREHVNIDSTRIHNGNFEFTGDHVVKPHWALIKIKGSFVATCDFYLEDGHIFIAGSRYNAKATGTPANAAYGEYNRDIASMGNDLYALNLNAVNEKDAQRRDSLKQELKRMEQLQKEREVAFIRRYPDSPISLRIAQYLPNKMSSSETLDMLRLLSPEQQQTEEIQQLRKRAEQLASAERGAVAPDFTLSTDRGELLSLTDFTGQYVLIDFWASWCAPCRASFPAIASLYERYRGKLTIIGVSLDRSETAWRKALGEEKCTWAQTWDEKGEVAKTYAVSAIPLLVLVDPGGIIVGRYNKADLTDELKQLF